MRFYFSLSIVQEYFEIGHTLYDTTRYVTVNLLLLLICMYFLKMPLTTFYQFYFNNFAVY